MEGGKLLRSVSVTVFRLDDDEMSCNPSKCKELTIKKRGNHDLYSPGMIPSCKEAEILGVTFQCDSKFSLHVKNKLIKANKSLHILTILAKKLVLNLRLTLCALSFITRLVFKYELAM